VNQGISFLHSHISVSQSGKNPPFVGDFDRQGGEKNKEGDRGEETTQRWQKCSM